MDLVDTYRTFHPKAEDYTFLSNAHGTFSRTDHNIRTKIKIIQSTFSDHNGIKLELSNTRKTKKFTNMWILNTLLANRSKKKSQRKLENSLRQVITKIGLPWWLRW